MRGISLRVALLMVVFASMASAAAGAQPDTFHWVDFHADADQPIVVWVTRALSSEKWTDIREIGVLYDAALVETVERATPDSLPSSDTFELWSVNLRNHAKTPLLKGVNLRWVDWMEVREGSPREIAILYDDCKDCAATTYFTTFHYDYDQHILAPRWLRGGQAVPVWTSTAPEGVNLAQMYALLAEPDGRQFLATWNHFDYGKQKPAEDYIYRYDVDSFNGLDRTMLVSNKDAEVMKQRLCAAQASHSNVVHGDVAELCQQEVKPRAERKPVTTPPANAQGRSAPPKARR